MTDRRTEWLLLEQIGQDLADVEACMIGIYKRIRHDSGLPDWPRPRRPLVDRCKAVTEYGPHGKLARPHPCLMPGDYSGGLCHIHARAFWKKQTARRMKTK